MVRTPNGEIKLCLCTKACVRWVGPPEQSCETSQQGLERMQGGDVLSLTMEMKKHVSQLSHLPQEGGSPTHTRGTSTISSYENWGSAADTAEQL